MSVLENTVKKAWKETKNTVLQVPEIERKVKDATSNEKWGPTGTQMREIAQATFSYHDLPVIMNAIWRRLNDHGKYWRHVYKSLLLIDYLLHNGSEQVIREARDHVVSIQTLCEFQYIDERDQDVGLSVRERAKLLVDLIHDEKRLKGEREKAKNTAKKFLVGMGSEFHGNYDSGYDRDQDRYDSNRDQDRESSYEPEKYNDTERNARFREDDEEPPIQESKVRPRAASGGISPVQVVRSNPTPNNFTTQQPKNLFDIDDIIPAPPQSKHLETEFFNSPVSTGQTNLFVQSKPNQNIFQSPNNENFDPRSSVNDDQWSDFSSDKEQQKENDDPVRFLTRYYF